jgi:hypothetical protein
MPPLLLRLYRALCCTERCSLAHTYSIVHVTLTAVTAKCLALATAYLAIRTVEALVAEARNSSAVCMHAVVHCPVPHGTAHHHTGHFCLSSFVIRRLHNNSSTNTTVVLISASVVLAVLSVLQSTSEIRSGSALLLRSAPIQRYQ